MPCGDDVGSAHQARRTGPAVDIDLTAVAILTRRSSHRNRVMLRTDRIDPATTHWTVPDLVDSRSGRC